jgi:hypothetical protein
MKTTGAVMSSGRAADFTRNAASLKQTGPRGGKPTRSVPLRTRRQNQRGHQQRSENKFGHQTDGEKRRVRAEGEAHRQYQPEALFKPKSPYAKEISRHTKESSPG